MNDANRVFNPREMDNAQQSRGHDSSADSRHRVTLELARSLTHYRLYRLYIGYYMDQTD